MKQIVEGQIQESEFKAFLLKKMKKIEGDYIDGVMSLDQAKNAFESIN